MKGNEYLRKIRHHLKERRRQSKVTNKSISFTFPFPFYFFFFFLFLYVFESIEKCRIAHCKQRVTKGRTQSTQSLKEEFK